MTTVVSSVSINWGGLKKKRLPSRIKIKKDPDVCSAADQITLARRVLATVCCMQPLLVFFFSVFVSGWSPAAQTSKAGRPLKVGKARLPPSKSMFTVYKGESVARRREWRDIHCFYPYLAYRSTCRLCGRTMSQRRTQPQMDFEVPQRRHGWLVFDTWYFIFSLQ